MHFAIEFCSGSRIPEILTDASKNNIIVIAIINKSNIITIIANMSSQPRHRHLGSDLSDESGEEDSGSEVTAMNIEISLLIMIISLHMYDIIQFKIAILITILRLVKVISLLLSGSPTHLLVEACQLGEPDYS